MAVHLETIDDVIRFLPDAPEYQPGNEAWQSASRVAVLLGITEQGLSQMRRRYRNSYEHRAGKRVLIYVPLFLLAWRFEKQERNINR